MSHKQTRRTIGVTRATYDRVMAYAAKHDTSASQVVQNALAPVLYGQPPAGDCEACALFQRTRGQPCIRHNSGDGTARAKAIGVVR